MANHQATEQMTGYLYQVRYALALLLNNDNSDSQISLEEFDDITFSKDDIPKQLIQLKHHVKKHGNLTDSSTDLWRTLKVWLDVIAKDPSLLNDTEFLIITTALAPEGTAASHLKEDNNRDTNVAYQKLKIVSHTSGNQAHKSYHLTFSNTDEAILRQLLDNVYIIDSAKNIIDVEQEIRKNIRYSCAKKFEDQVCERLEGWWYGQAIKALCSEEPIFITQNQVRSLIVAISHEYTDENLPIENWNVDDLEEGDLGLNEKLFYEQLKLISLGNHRMRNALRDYYRAFKQRASWVRNDLLYVNELERYEQRLIDEWDHCFAAMEDDLAKYGNSITEGEKAQQGRRLLSEIENKNILIRPKCQDAFVMRGSYHILADQLKVGWHINFFARLKELLTT